VTDRVVVVISKKIEFVLWRLQNSRSAGLKKLDVGGGESKGVGHWRVRLLADVAVAAAFATAFVEEVGKTISLLIHGQLRRERARSETLTPS
jgi:RsiW-degrading membrane proteinase PrsW (M82 family)